MPKSNSTLLIHCPDQTGIVAEVTAFLHSYHANIIYLDQYVDNVNNEFFMRVQWVIEDAGVVENSISSRFEATIAKSFQMSWQIFHSIEKPRMAIFVSHESHCLYDILARQANGEWEVEVPCILGNHSKMEQVANRFNIPFYYSNVSEVGKAAAEKEQLTLLNKHKVDFIVLARYMQVLSEDFLENYKDRIINIHHSFLPAFAGAKPYHSAFARGVKIVGATSHYVTKDLDAGPIIEQDVVRVSHRDSVDEMKRKGRDLEKLVLSRAIRKHLEHKVLVYGNKTIIFD